MKPDMLNKLNRIIDISRKAIETEQQIEIFEDFLADKQKLVFKITIDRNNNLFDNLIDNHLTAEQATQLSELSKKRTKK